MRPFSLEWWMEKLDITTQLLLFSFSEGDMDKFEKYSDLWYWIKDRIEKKFTQKPE